MIKRHETKTVGNVTGEEVPGARDYFTAPLELQHKEHYVMEASSGFNAILPFWWTILRTCIQTTGETRPLPQTTVEETECSEFSLEWRW